MGTSESLSDTAGLSKAYQQDTGVYTQGNTMFLAGTKSISDAIDDIRIPFGKTSTTQRYMDADRVLKAIPIQRVVGHSLGGAVALEIGKNHPNITTTTYGAPVMSTAPGDRHKQAFDPVAIFDWGAQTKLATHWNPHNYSGLGGEDRLSSGPSSGYYFNKNLSLYR